ncbi:MAG: ligand-binding sensor domain-containing protein, partial [Blastocatellia bacterium]
MRNQFVRAMTTDRSGNIWAGYFDTGTVSRWEPTRAGDRSPSSFPRTITLGSDGIRAIYVDTEGNIWVGIQGGGLVRLKERKVTVYASEDGLPNDGIQAITDDGADGVWATTSLGLAHIAGGPDHKITGYMPRNGFNAIYRDRDGALWIGGDGLVRFDNGVSTTYSTAQGLSNATVHAIVRDNEGNLWAGTVNGLNQLRDGRFIVYHNSAGLPLDDIRFILVAGDGSLWLGTVGGLSHFHGGAFTNYTTENGLSNNYVRSILQDDDGAMRVGTYGGGLNRFKNGRFVHITMKDGLLDPFISQILDDGRGRLWMLSNHGIL